MGWGQPPTKSKIVAAHALKVPDLRREALRYQRFLVSYQNAVNRSVLKQLESLRKELPRADGLSEVVADAFEVLGASVVNWLSNEVLFSGILKAASATQAVNFAKYDRGAYKQIGINALPQEINQDLINNWISSNVGLITKTNKNQVAALENLFRDSAFSGMRSYDLEASINKIFGGSKNSVALIARDQTMKLNSLLDRAKQQNAGIDGYYWRGSRDERERLKHALREGQYFDWNNPPPGGHPGYEYQCRCTAEAAIDRALLSKKEWEAEAEKRAPEDKRLREEAIAKAKAGPLRKKKKASKH